MKKLLFLGFALIALTACSGQATDKPEVSKVDPLVLEYDIEQGEFSPLMEQQGNEKTLEAYLFAVEHPEVLDYMPCYCGCQDEGHVSNTDCFVDHVDGNVAKLDSMGLG